MKHRILWAVLLAPLLLAAPLSAQMLGKPKKQQDQYQVAFKINPREAEIVIDGTPMTGFIFILDRGTHKFTVRAPGYEDWNQTVNLTQNLRLEVNLETVRTKNPVLDITSNVKGADVYIDGKKAGTTDARISLPKGSYDLRVSARGYQDYRENIRLNADARVNADLVADNYFLTVQSNVNGADVLVEGRKVGRAGDRITLPPGKYQVKVTAPGYSDYVEIVDFNRDTVVKADLRSLTGWLEVQTGKGNWDITVDGKRLKGRTDRLELEAGSHTVTVEYGDLKATVTVNVEPGKTVTLRPGLSVDVR